MDRRVKSRSPITAIEVLVLAGCETSGGAAGVGDVPPAAVSACSIRADDFWSAAPGLLRRQRPDGNRLCRWELAIADGHWQLPVHLHGDAYRPGHQH